MVRLSENRGAERARILKTSFEDVLPLKIVRKSPQLDCSSHSHEGFVEMVVVTHGEGTHEWTDAEGRKRATDVSAGDLFIIHPAEIHSYRSTSNLALINVIFQPLINWLPIGDVLAMPGYHALFQAECHMRRIFKTPSALRLDSAGLKRVSTWIGEIEDELENRSPGYVVNCKAVMMRLLAFLCRSYPVEEGLLRASRSARSVGNVSEVINYIEAHYAEEISFEALRSVAGLSHSGLLRAFKSCFGQSPIDFLIHTRIAKAKELLGDLKLNISEISLQVGFNDPNYFSRKFKAITGFTPREYRRKFCPDAAEMSLR